MTVRSTTRFVALGLVLLLVGCSKADQKEFHMLRILAGTAATTCGISTNPKRDAKVNTCIANASAHQHAFYARYFFTENGVTMTRGFARNPRGRLFMVTVLHKSDNPFSASLGPPKVVFCAGNNLLPDEGASERKIYHCDPLTGSPHPIQLGTK
jgi:hypothetical protein